MILDEDEIQAMIEILNERPPSALARVAMGGVLPEGIPAGRPDVREALERLRREVT